MNKADKQRIRTATCFYLKSDGRHQPNLNRCDDCGDKFTCFTEKHSASDIEIETPKQYLMNLPNTPEGRQFYDDLKKRLNKDRYTVVRYGRAKHRKDRFGSQRVSIDICDYFGVYLRDSQKYEEYKRDRYRAYEFLRDENTANGGHHSRP